VPSVPPPVVAAPTRAAAPHRTPTTVAGARPPGGASTPVPPHLVTVYAPGGAEYGQRRPNNPRRVVRITSGDVTLDAPVVEVYPVDGAWEVADYAAGHHYTSANPGEGGNIVITGHNNWRGEVFRYLEFLHLGNTIVLTTQDGAQYHYTVTQMQKVPEKGEDHATRLAHAAVMDPIPSERLTLITCWPYKTYTHRLIIFAVPTAP
jgi:sortase A